MREPAAAWSCPNPYCFAGLKAVPWDHTLLLPQHGRNRGPNHTRPPPFLKNKGDRCEEREGNKTKKMRMKETDKKKTMKQKHEKRKRGGRVQMAV